MKQGGSNMELLIKELVNMQFKDLHFFNHWSNFQKILNVISIMKIDFDDDVQIVWFSYYLNLWVKFIALHHPMHVTIHATFKVL